MTKLDVDQKKLGGICRKYGVVAIYVYGSRVKGYAAPDSDTDVAIVVKDKSKLKRGSFSIYDVADEVENVLEAKNPDVRVVDLNNSSVFLFEIVSDGRVIYQENDYSRLNFEENVLRLYYDSEYMREVYKDYLYADIKARAYAN